jgi:hypothetical protein
MIGKFQMIAAAATVAEAEWPTAGTSNHFRG